MAWLAPRDIEDALRMDLGTIVSGCSVSASPVPDNLESALPHAVVYRLGGVRSDRVVDEHDVSIDVYAQRWAQAVSTADLLAGALDALCDTPTTTSGVDWLSSELTTQPYNNPDPDHEDVPRVSFAATVICRPALVP